MASARPSAVWEGRGVGLPSGVEPVVVGGSGLGGVHVDACVAHGGVAGGLSPLDQGVVEVHGLRTRTPGCSRP